MVWIGRARTEDQGASKRFRAQLLNMGHWNLEGNAASIQGNVGPAIRTTRDLGCVAPRRTRD